MEKTVLENNLEQISRYNPKLSQKIAELTHLENSFELLEAKSGDANLLYNDILLHDNIDPQEEAYNIFHSVSDDSKSSVNVLFGLGLGYIFTRFALSSKGKIIVFEPNLDILRITLEIADLSEYLAKDNILIVDSISDLEKYIEKLYFANAKINLISHKHDGFKSQFLSSYASLNPEILAELFQKIEFIKGLYENNYNNLFLNCINWTIAGVENLPEVMEHNELETLRNKFANKPAVIISAGPSLDKNIDFLKDYQDKAVIFCVGTAVKTAVKHGIRPDFLTIVENNDCTAQVSGVDTSDMNMILMPFTHEKFHKIKTKRKFNFYPKNDFTAIWLANLLDIPIEDYYNKGTVSLCALFSAKILGCNPIIVIGQDLAYSDGRCYSKDSAYNELKCVKNPDTGNFEIVVDNFEAYVEAVKPHFSPKSDDPEEIARTEVMNHELGVNYAKSRINSLLEGLYFVKDHHGEMIPTEASYAIFISYFEQAAKELDQTKLVNSTEQGAYLEGFEHISLKDALASYTGDPINVESVISEAVKSGRNLMYAKGKIVLDEIDKTIGLIESNLNYFVLGEKYSSKLYKEVNNNRMNAEYFKEHCQQALSCYIAIDENILSNSPIIMGLIYSQYSRLANYLSTHDDILNVESIKTFAWYIYDFHKTGHEILLDKLKILKSTRERLNESCNSAS
jgi:hypothetical protein